MALVLVFAVTTCKPRAAPHRESEPTATASDTPSTAASASAAAPAATPAATPAAECGARRIPAADGGCARDPAWRIDSIALPPSGNYACARYTSGDVRCAGFRALGGADDVHDAVDIALGASHACVRRKAGTVACWGSNDLGQIGDGSQDAASAPSAVTGLAGATAIAAGDGHTCAIHAGGKVACWGSNFEGQVDGKKDGDQRVPVDVPGVAGATRLALGLTFSCARLVGGSVTCWGAFPRDRDDRGPRTVPGLRGADDIAVTGAVFNPTLCARTGGSIRCIAGEGHATPRVVAGIADATAVVAGNVTVCALEKSGAVACGNQPFEKATAFAVPSARSIAMRGLHVCTIGRDGELACREGDGKPLDDVFGTMETL